jgi:lauroyl/myristoyl acyltransferase
MRRLAAQIRDRAYYWLVQHYPATAFQLLGFVGRMTDRRSWTTHCVSAEEIGALFQDMPRESRARVVAEIRSLHLRRMALQSVVERVGFEPLVPLVRLHGFDQLTALHAKSRPAILLGWHLGAEFAVVSGLYRAGVPTLFIANSQGYKLRPGFEVCDTAADEPEIIDHSAARSATRPRVLSDAHEVIRRAHALRRGIAHLRSGGVVLIAADGRPGDSEVEVTCLGRRVSFRRGPALLARLSGAPIFPVTGRWVGFGRRIDVVLHDPLPRPLEPEDRIAQYESALMTEAARWYEKQVGSHPEQLHADRLRDWLKAPKVQSLPGSMSVQI